MNNTLRTVLVAAASLAAAISAQAAYSSGDLLIGFTQPGSATDYIYDLGKTLINGQSWDLSSGLFGQYTNLNHVSFGVVGAVNTNSTIFSTTDGTFAPNESAGLFTTIRANVATIGQNSVFGSAAATPGQSVTYSWFSQTDQAPGTPGNTFQNNLDNPNAVTPASFSSGSMLAYLYSNDNQGDSAVLQGNFSLSSGGVVTFTAAPEPSALSFFLAGLGLLVFSFRRRSYKPIQRI